MAITIEARDANLNRLGLIPFDEAALVLRHNGVSTWSLDMDRKHPKAALFVAGGGVIVKDDDLTLLSGPSRVFTTIADDDGPEERLTVTGVSDEIWLATRVIYPDPSQPSTNQVALEADIRSGIAETVMKALVNLNAGPGALAARQVGGLVIATDLGRGPSLDSSARFTSLLDQLVELGTTANLGFTVIQSGNGLVFDVYGPVDRSATARFSRGIGNLRGYTYDITAPSATTVIVAGQGEGVGRTFIERTNTEAELDWSQRVELFLDRRDTNVTATLEQAGDEALLEKGPGATLSLTPIDTPLMKYGRDYGRGDIVRVDITGGSIIDVISQVTIEVKADGTFVRPSVGSPTAARGVPKILQQLSDLARRQGLLERRR